jgi:glutaredoxin-dependent peroxiredoxin
METRVLDLLKKRSAYRAIDARPVEQDKLRALLEAAQLSASCMNNQPWRFLVLEDAHALEKGRMALADGNYWAKSAPVLIVGLSRADLDCRPADGREYFLFDLGMAAQNLILQATEFGLVARPMAGFQPSVLRQAFQIPESYTILIMLAVGYEGDLSTLKEHHRKVSVAPRKRRPLESNFLFNRFDEPETSG